MITPEAASASKARAENLLDVVQGQLSEAVRLKKSLLDIVGKGSSTNRLVQASCGADGTLLSLRIDRERAGQIAWEHIEEAVVQAAKAATHDARKQALKMTAEFRKQLGEIPTSAEFLAEVLPDADIEYEQLPVSPMRKIPKAMLHEPSEEQAAAVADEEPDFTPPDDWIVSRVHPPAH
jgi:DNA-binding protein YbaB